MKKLILSLLAGIPLAIAGCGGASDLTGSDEVTDGEIMAVALTGSGASGTEEVTVEAQADMNAQIMGTVSKKIAEQLDAEMESEEFRLAYEQAEAEAASDLTKDVSVGISLKGLVISISDEELAFAGGSMLLNGDLTAKLKFRGRGTLALEIAGELTSELRNIERSGFIKDIPYSLSLEGTNVLGLDGALAVTIKNWKVSALTADFKAGVVESNVIAMGSIADKQVVGAVDMSDVAIALTNPDVLKHPEAFTAACSGEISTKVNDNVVAACTMDPSCLACK